MSIVHFTTSTTGVTFTPGVVNGVLISGTTTPVGTGTIRLVDGASTTAGTLKCKIHSVSASVYVPLGGLEFDTSVFVASTAAYGGITIVYQ